MKEQLYSPDKMFKYKFLKAVTPEAARRYDKLAEAPAFISPFTTDNHHCNDCHQQTAPLFYQVGHVTVSHSIHEYEGGIYHFATPNIENHHLRELNNYVKISNAGWIAEIESIGRYIQRSLYGDGRSEAIKPTRMVAHCTSIDRIKKEYCSKRLKTGIAISKQHQRDILLPVCDNEEIHPELLSNAQRFRFKTNFLGEILFSHL